MSFICIYMYNRDDKYEFEWDSEKNQENQKKHGYSFQEGSQVFYDSNVLHLEDPKHSCEEDRYIAVGKNKEGIVLTVRYTLRNEKVRIFGVAYWRKWRKYYERENP